MNELYSIKSETLTGICDVLRSELGETKAEAYTVPVATYEDHNGYSDVMVITIPGATTMHVEITYQTYYSLGGSLSNSCFYKIAAGAWEKNTMPADAILLQSQNQASTFLTFENTDTITIYNNWLNSPLYTNDATAVIYGIDANGNYVDFEGSSSVEKIREVANTYQSDEIAGAIRAVIERLSTLPEEALIITGDCQYKFASNGWKWFIDMHGDRVTTQNITNCAYMFVDSSALTEIPFEINITDRTSLSYMFSHSEALTAIPKVNFPGIAAHNKLDYLFSHCHCVREIPEWVGDLLEADYTLGTSNSNFAPWGNMFSYCYSLREIPAKVIQYLKNPKQTGNYYGLAYSNPFNYCSCLNELKNIFPDDYTYTSGQWGTWCNSVFRLKDFTFAVNEDGTPYIRQWKSQTLDVSRNVGYSTNGTGAITNYNSGITIDKEVKDDATYQALKNDPDWFTVNIAYSRYNHDSAVNTINSLPDTSAYLATAGGTNTIKFRGAAGSATDGGAINTLTDAEIAVAAAKGWTVTLV